MNLKEKIYSASIELLCFVPATIGILFAMVGLVLNKISIFPQWVIFFVVIMIGVSWGFVGIFIVVRKQSPAPWYSKGLLAVLQGIFISMSGLSLIIIGLINLIK